MSQSPFIQSVSSLFKYYKILGERTFDQLEESQFFITICEEDNSIGNIVKHLHGNMLSRWTEFLTSDGEKEWRDRDGEFIDTISTKEELLCVWNEGWEVLFNALNEIEESDLDKEITIRGEKHAVTDAIMRQQMHYAYHVGQIVFVAKTVKGKDWVSLSIPKNESRKYNADYTGKVKENQESIWGK